MASIVQRGKKHCVVYKIDFGDGKPRQKWETFDTAAEAKRRKTEIEYHQSIGNLAIPKCTTLDDLLKEYVSLYGKSVCLDGFLCRNMFFEEENLFSKELTMNCYTH